MSRAASDRRWTAPRAIKGILVLQVFIALFLMGGDLLSALPRLAFPSEQPGFDSPVRPGDQTRRFSPRDTPLGPTRPYPSTRDMPNRLLFESDGDTLTLTGAIAPGDADRLQTHLTTLPAPPATLRLNSPGGAVHDALDIGRQIRAAGFDTTLRAGDICLSACPYMLAAGVTRTVDDAAQVGVHQHYFDTNTVLPAFLAVADIQRGQAEVMGYLNAMGIDPLVMRHALATPPDEIYVLLPEELVTYKFIERPAD